MGHPDLERGRLSVFETLSGRYPVTAAGFLYRTLDGRLVEPWLAGSLGQVESVTHTMLADGVVIAVRETLEGRRHRRTFTVRRIGDALQIRARSLDGPGLASGGYAGFSAGEIAGTSDGVAIRVPMMDTVPVTMLDHRWFVSALPDYPRSRASRFSQRGPEALANGFVNEMMALYEPDEAGDATPTDETVWVTLSPDIRDTFAVPSASASAYRRDLDGRVHLSLSVGSEPNAGSYEGAARYIERLRSFGVDDLAVHLRDWSDPDTPPPHPGLPDPARGGEAGWRELMVAAAGGLAPSRTYTTTVAGCPGALNPFYRPEDRVTGTDGQPKRLTDQAGGLIACPDGSEAVRYLLAPDAALRIALEPECAVPGTSAAHVAEIAAWNPAYPLPGAQDNALDRAAPANHAATVAEAVAAYKRLFLGLQASGGPVYADGATHWGPMGFDSFYAGYVDALARFVVGHDASSGGTVTLVAPDYELLVIRPRTVAYGLGRYADFFADDLVDGSLGVPLGDDAVDRWRATNLAFGHAGSWSSGDSLGARDWLSPPEQVKEYHLMRALQRRILSSGTARVTYHSGGSVGDLSWALASELDLSAPRIRLEFDSLELWVNFAAEPWSIDSAAGSWQLPTYGWLATGDDHFLAYSAVQDGRRVDLVSAPEVTLIDGRGVYWSAAGLAGTDLAIRLADGRRIEEVPGGDLRVLP